MGREELLDSAFRVLAREGGATPDAVARAGGVSKALVFHHFGSVAGLHDAMAERVLRATQEGLDAIAREAPHPRLRLEALARALLTEPPEPPREAGHVARFWLEGDRGRVRDALVEDFVAKTLREMRFHGDARSVASLLLARWHGATLVYANGGAIDFDAEQERALAELDAAIRAR